MKRYIVTTSELASVQYEVQDRTNGNATGAVLSIEPLYLVQEISAELGAVEWRAHVLRERLHEAMRDAVGGGLAHQRVADAAGVSRQRIGQILAVPVPLSRSELDAERTRRIVGDRRA